MPFKPALQALYARGEQRVVQCRNDRLLSATFSGLLITLETVAVDTPACCATSPRETLFAGKSLCRLVVPALPCFAFGFFCIYLTNSVLSFGRFFQVRQFDRDTSRKIIAIVPINCLMTDRIRPKM
jgi:hypothetical protein